MHLRAAHARLQPRLAPGARVRPVVRPLRASADDGEGPASLSLEDAMKVLGISPGASTGFDSILAAKNKQLAASSGDQERQMEIEAAYDVLFMQSMKRRIASPSTVPSSVRFADVTPTRKRSSAGASAAQPSLLQKLPGGGISVAPAKQSVAAGQAAVFAGLATWSVAGALLETPDAQAADTAGLQLAAALAFAVYGFREFKRLPLGRAVGLSLGAMVAGILLGAGLNAWLRVDIVPLGSFGSPGVLVSTFGIAALALASAFLA
ncbi:hypothetical protein HT031_002266 [Scenedesmus sp. PABB004]|nr:hypothetical protein HT031_002266 [Scenedesmus sp. PABB004]